MITSLFIVIFLALIPYLARISSLPENESRNISIILQYAADSEYDIDNNGFETINDVIDFTVKNTIFALNLNDSYLSTRWEIYSLDDNISTVLCYGSEIACNFVNLVPSASKWNDTLYLYYGRYGASYNNIVSTQVIYVNYNLSTENPYSEIYYSDWLNLSATFVDIAENITDNLTNLSQNLTFQIENLTNQSNNLPICSIPNLTIIENNNLTIDLNSYCSDLDNDILSYSYESIENIQVKIENSFLTLIPDINFTGIEILILVANDTHNATSYNISINAIDVIGNISKEETTQLYAEINKPVKWRKKVSLSSKKENVSVVILEQAFNLSIHKIENNESLNISETNIKINHRGKIKNLDYYEIDKKIEILNKNLNRVKDSEKKTEIAGKINELNLLKSAKIEAVGFAALEAEAEPIIGNESILIIQNKTKELVIEYETPAPEKEEEVISSSKKRIKIISELDYENVLAYADITEVPKYAIKLYWIKNDTKELFENITYIDSNSNNLIDKIEWVVPHLSNQTFEIELNIIDVQTFPTVGGYWTVRFNTTGTANLTISASNGTTYAEKEIDDTTTINDLDILELKCDNNILEPLYIVEVGNLSLDGLNEISGDVVSDKQKNSLSVNFFADKKEENGFHSQAIAPDQDLISSRTRGTKQNLFKYLSVQNDLTKLGSHSLAIASDQGYDFLRGSAGSNSLRNEMNLPPPASKNNNQINNKINIADFFTLIPSAYALHIGLGTYSTININGKTYALLTKEQLQEHSYKIIGIYYENFNCDNKTSYWTVKVSTQGTHTQRFDFDGLTAYANNYALQGIVFVDNTEIDFSQGTLHLTNISGSGAGANVTLNFTINTGNMSGGHLIYNITGNFTSRTFDSGQNHTVYDKIAWKSSLSNSSEILGAVYDAGSATAAIFYRNGSFGVDTTQADLASNVDVTGALRAYTLPAGLSYDDIAGFAMDDDATSIVYAFMLNGSVLQTASVASLNQDLSFTGAVVTYTIPANFNTSDIIDFAIDSSTSDTAAYFKNGSYVSNRNDENPPVSLNEVWSYTILTDFNIENAVGIAFNRVNGEDDVAMFFTNRSMIFDTSATSQIELITFSDGVALTIYQSDLNLTESTNITLQTRVANDTNLWTDWSNIYIDSEGTQTVEGGNGRYIQYKAIFFTPDKYITPYLENVSINYTIDVIPPVVNSSINNTSPKFGEVINFTANISDTSGLSFCQFIDNQSTNGAKRFFNVSIAGQNDKCSQNFTILRLRADVINFSLIVNDTYNNKNQTDLLITVANTPPTTPAILFPTSDLKTNLQPLDLNVTFTADVDNDFINVTYYINGKLNQTTPTNTTLNASDGVYILNVSLFDRFDSSSNTTINFTIDTTSPIVNTSLNKSLTNIVFGEVINLTANTTDLNGLSFGQIIVNDTGFLRYFNFSLNDLTKAEFSQNITISCYGGCVVNFTARVNDTANNFRTNDTTITVFDNIKPRINSSINNSAPKINEVVNVTANVTDEVALSFCQFIENQSLIDGAKNYINKSLTGANDQCSQNYTIRLSRGNVINFTVIVNDTTNNLNQSQQIITIANTAPTAPTILYPTANLNTSQQPLDFNVTFAGDLDNDAITIRYYINGTLNQTSATNTTFNASDGLYVLNVSLFDGFDSSSNSTVTFSLDTKPPRIFLESPGNNTWNNLINISFRYNVSDEFLGTGNCTLILDNKANVTNSTIIQNVPQFLNVTLNDTYGINWSVNCTDYVGNTNYSETRIIKIDTSFPTIINVSINVSEVNVNNKICLNATVNDTYSMIEFVYAEIDRPVSANLNVSLTNDTADPNSCAGFGSSIWSFAYTALEEGETNWTTTYVKDFAGNLNSTKVFGLNWSQTAKIFVNSSILQPLANFELNESDLDINYSFTMMCNATCRPDSTSACTDVTIFPQYFNDSWNDITNFSSQLFTYQMNKSCGNLPIGEHCNATFNVTSSIYSGNNNFSLRCKAKGSNTPNDFSILTTNVTVNDHPTAIFTYPLNTQHIKGIVVINSSDSFDDQNISRYVIELDDNSLFTSSLPLCDTNESNCTFNTFTQTQCIEDTPTCYLRLNLTDNDGLKNSTFIQIQIDNTAPSVRLEAPLNNTHSNESTINFNYTAFDTNLSTCSLYHNETGIFTRNETNDTIRNNTQDTITITLLDNLLIWNIGCNDTAGNLGFNSSNYTLILDTLNPGINFTNPTLPNNTYTTGNYILVNVSVNEINFANITFYLYNSSLNLVNESNFTTQTFFLNFSNLADINELYYYNVTVRDRASRQNSTETRQITLDNINPRVNFTGPTENNNTYFNRNFIFVNVTINETNFANATFYLYDVSLTLINETNITQGTDIQNLSTNFTPTNLNQRYYYNVTVRDRASLINSTETRQITLDNTTPAIGLINPINNTLTKNNTINFTYFLVETNIKNCTLYANFSGIFQENLSDSSAISGINNNITLFNVPDGLFIWNVRCYDLAGNDAFNSTNFTLDIDTTPPTPFNLDTPINDTQSINSSPRLNWTEAIDVHFLNYTVLVDDNIDFSSIDFVYKLGGNYSNNTLFVNDSWEGNKVWYWKVIAYDLLNQSTNSTDYFAYTIDNGTPQITLLTPFNHSVENQSLINLNFNVTDEFTVANCSLIINNEIKTTSSSIIKNVSNTISFNLANGNYNWSVNCTDKAGNINESVFRNITVNAPPLMPTSFVDTTEIDFSQGTLHLTNISGSGAGANVTLNYTTNTGNMSGGHFIYNITGNFTSRIFDTGATNTNLNMIKWSVSQRNSSDVMGYAKDAGVDDIGAFYRNGSYGADLTHINFNSDADFTEAFAGYTIPAGLSYDDIVGFGWDHDAASDIIYAFFRNGSVAATPQTTALGADLSFSIAGSYTLPQGFNTSDIIGTAIDTGASQSAVFFKNRSFVVDTNSENPPFVFDTVMAFTIIPPGFSTEDVTGTEHDNGAGAMAMFFRNGSFVSDTTAANFGSDIDFASVYRATYQSDANLTESTNITLQTRASNDSITFTDWSIIYENYTGQPLETTTARYIQYKAVFTTPDKYITPYLENVSINHTETNAPRINFTFPTPGNNSFINVNYIYINVSIFDEHSIDKCILELDGANQSLLILRDGRNTTCFVNKTSLAEGKHSFKAYANDSFGNMNSTEIRNVTIDYTLPDITINFPVNDFNITADVINFNWTAVDNLDINLTCNLTINDVGVGFNITNTTSIHMNFTVVNLTEGGNFWNVTCVDDANNTKIAGRNFTVVKGPSILNITLTDDNETINLTWNPLSYAESYSIYIVDNYLENFAAIANISGLTNTYYADSNAANKTQRFYKIAAVKGSVNKTTIKTVGKYEFELINNSNAISDWNLISLPLNITNFVLYNGSNNGSDLRVNPLNCIKSLWFYNATIGEFKRTDYNGSAWVPAAGSENFTSLQIGRGYWAEINQTCNLTFVGEVQTSNLSINLETGWNIVGWYSPNSSRLPTNYQPPYPIVVNPANSVRAIGRYNPLTDRFEVTIYYAISGQGWGWWPSSNNKGFTSVDPTRGYYYDVSPSATWVHKPNTEKD